VSQKSRPLIFTVTSAKVDQCP